MRPKKAVVKMDFNIWLIYILPAVNTHINPVLNDVIDLVIQSVNLHHVDRRTLHEQTSLGQGGLELDSVDVLEIIVAVENKFGLKVKTAEEGRKYFRTLGTIAELVQLKTTTA